MYTNDSSLLETISDLIKFEDWQLRQIYRCGMYLQVITVGNLATVCGPQSFFIESQDFQPRLNIQESIGHCKILRVEIGVLHAAEFRKSLYNTPWRIATPRQLFQWEVSPYQTRLYRRLRVHAMMHRRKVPHMNSSRLHKKLVSQARQIALSEVPTLLGMLN